MLHDVIIAGAGPAGSTCARTCARAGLSVLLIDQESFPRRKPCGGALSARAVSLLDIPLPPHLIEQECRGVRVHYGSHVVERRKGRPIAFMIDRSSFDGFLAEQAVRAGALFREGTRVTGVQQVGRMVRVSTPGRAYEARFLVGADGSASTVAQAVRPAFDRSEVMAAMVGTIAVDPANNDGSNGLLVMYFGVAPLGYGWVFPHGNHRSVGIMGLASAFSEPSRHFADFCRTVGIPAMPARGHTIPLGGISRRITAERILLAGDAAGFADPFHGEGMAHAIHSGLLAGKAVIDGVQGRKDSLQSYERACEQNITGDLRTALRMSWMLERHPQLFITIFFQSEKTLGRYLDIAAGDLDYRGFQRWLVARLPGYLLRHACRRPSRA